LFIDEFGLFAAHDCSHMTKILSECRKYRLHLGLSHQTISQVDSARLHGALENAKLKILFNCGRTTAQAVMNQVFFPDTERIKHEITDEDAQQRSHPLFESIYNQVEVATQHVMRLQNREIIVKLPGREELQQLTTPTVPKARVSWDEVHRIKHTLYHHSGRPMDELEQACLTRTTHITQHPNQRTQPTHPYDFWQGTTPK